LTRQIAPPRAMRNYQGAVDSLGSAIASIEHFIGGPMQNDEAFALMERRPVRPQEEGSNAMASPSAASTSSSGSNGNGSGLFKSLVSVITPKPNIPSIGSDWSQFLVKRYPTVGELYFASLSDILGLAKQRWTAARESSDIKVFWGYASWGSTQLLAELARRSWGISESWDARNGLQGMHAALQWKEVVDHMSIARASEYSRNE